MTTANTTDLLAVLSRNASSTSIDSSITNYESDDSESRTALDSSGSALYGPPRPDAFVNTHPLAGLHAPSRLSLTTFATLSSSSTVTGIGMLSGRAIKRVGEAIIELLEEPIIRRRLVHIRRHFDDCRLRDALLADAGRLAAALADIVELTRPSYSWGLSDEGYPKRIVRSASALVEKTKAWLLEPCSIRWDSAIVLLNYYSDLYWLHSDLDESKLIIDQLLRIPTSYVVPPEGTEANLQLENAVNDWLIPPLCDMMTADPGYLCLEKTPPNISSIFTTWKTSIVRVVSLNRHCHFLEYVLKALVSQIPSVIVSAVDITLTTAVCRMFSPLAEDVPELRVYLCSLLSLSTYQQIHTQSVHNSEVAKHIDAALLLYNHSPPPPDDSNPTVVQALLNLFRQSLQWDYVFSVTLFDHVRIELIRTMRTLVRYETLRAELYRRGAAPLLWASLSVFEGRRYTFSSQLVFIIVDLIEALGAHVSRDILAECWFTRGCSIADDRAPGGAPFSWDIYVWAMCVFVEGSETHPTCWKYLEDYRVLECLISGRAGKANESSEHERIPESLLRKALLTIMKHAWALEKFREVEGASSVLAEEMKFQSISWDPPISIKDL